MPLRHAVGVDRIMWGNDFPHREGCWPWSHEHLRLAFGGVPIDEVTAMVGGNAARVYGFDLDALAPVAARVGPLVDEVGPARSRTTRSLPRRCGARPSRWLRPAGEEHTMSSSPLRGPHPRAAAQPRAPGHLRRRLGHVPRRRLRDGPRRAGVGPPTADRATGRRPREGHRSRPSTSAGPGCRRSAPGRSRWRRRHEGTEGWYALLMPMTTEQSVIGGRETFGEPKKLGQVALDRDGDRVRAPIARLGTTIVEISGTVGAPIETTDGTRTDFYFKFLLAPDGKGFDDEPSLVYCHRDETTREAHRSTAPSWSCATAASTPWPTSPCAGS